MASSTEKPSVQHRLLKMARVCMSFLIRISPSEKLTDILVWPISKRLFGKNYSEIVRVKNTSVEKGQRGFSMEVYGDMEDMVNKTLMFMSGYKELSWEPVTARFVALIAEETKCAIDAGSHIGYYPLIISSVNPKALVYAFEPNPKTYERLVKNIVINTPVSGSSNVYPVAAALGDISGEQKMYFDFGQSSFVESARTHAGEGMVTIKTIDELFSDSSETVFLPDLMIFDAEGFEPNILKGGLQTIAKAKPNIIFEINPKALRSAGSSVAELFDILLTNGYSIFIIDDDYTHGLTVKSGLEISLSPYEESNVENVSFVNAFATIDPNRFVSYIKNS